VKYLNKIFKTPLRIFFSLKCLLTCFEWILTVTWTKRFCFFSTEATLTCKTRGLVTADTKRQWRFFCGGKYSLLSAWKLELNQTVKITASIFNTLQPKWDQNPSFTPLSEMLLLTPTSKACNASFWLISTSFDHRFWGYCCVIYLLFCLVNYKEPWKQCTWLAQCNEPFVKIDVSIPYKLCLWQPPGDPFCFYCKQAFTITILNI